MAFIINNVNLVGGNLVKDAELKYTSNGFAKLRFSVAMNHKFKDKATQEIRENVSYFNVILWGKIAESLATYLVKGQKVAVEGRLSQLRWTADDGSNKSIVEIVASNVVLMGDRNNEQRPSSQAQQPQYNQGNPPQQQNQNPQYQGHPYQNDDVPF